MTKEPPNGLPARFGPDVTVRDLDLDQEEFVVGGQRLTTQRAAELAEKQERRSGRPSLTGHGKHSPALNLRIPQGDKDELEAVASRQGRRISDVVREAVRQYLDRQAP